MNSELTVEVCVDSLESAVAAERGGAKRVELCSSLAEGGVTPSAGLIATARQNLSINLHVIIRPRGGDFCYSPDEFAVMKKDILMAKQLGANGVVFGILDVDGRVDIPRTRDLVQYAMPLATTYHRAFDMSADLGKSLEDVVEAGADRVLTSGGASTAIEGIQVLRGLVEVARGRIVVLACGGIDIENVHSVIEKTGVREIHVSLRTTMPSPMRYRNPNLSMGTLRLNEYERAFVLDTRVEQLLQAVSGSRPSSKHS